MDDERVAIFESTVENDQVRVVDEKHYVLLAADLLQRPALIDYR